MCARTRLVNAHKWHIQAQLQTTTRKTCISIALDLDLVSLCDQRKENGRRVPYLVSISFPNVWHHLEDGCHRAWWVDGCKTSWDPSQLWGPPMLCSFTILVETTHVFLQTCLPANTAHESTQTNAIPYWNLVHQNQNSKRKSFQLVHKGHHVVAVSFVDCKGSDLERTNNCNRDAENRWPEQSDPPNVLSSCSCCGVQIISMT